MNHKEKLAYALISTFHILLKNLGQDVKLIEKPCAGGLLIDRCVTVGNNTIGIIEDCEIEVYDEETAGFERFTYDEVDLVIDAVCI